LWEFFAFTNSPIAFLMVDPLMVDPLMVNPLVTKPLTHPRTHSHTIK